MNSLIPKYRIYWICQLAGWGMFVVIWAFFSLTFDKFSPLFIKRLVLFASLALVFTHIMRSVIIKSDILRKSVAVQIGGVIIITLFFSALTGYAEVLLSGVFELKKKKEHESFFLSFLDKSIGDSLYLFIWNCIYFIYHYIEKNRTQQFDTLKLEALIKELELKTIKSHINPHFIFNALNSIRALIDENPGRARNAITELSNILRSSMQAEKHETVSFERELNIVKDYLALEHIRFEDRLTVEYDIDKATLCQPVPPMMLQTLVENAIKHGISKQVAGGVVRIVSSFKGRSHELVIQNTGRLDGEPNENGFGLPGTRSRLYLMFGDRAAFKIKEISEGRVEATVSLPLL